MTRIAIEPEIAAGIVEQGHGDMHAILEVALDRLDYRLLVLQDDIHDVGAPLRIEAHMGADGKPPAVYPKRDEARFRVVGTRAFIVAGGEIDR